jgi:hypothetical protein
MTQEEPIDALQRAVKAGQYDALQQAIDWLLSRSYLARERAWLASTRSRRSR